MSRARWVTNYVFAGLCFLIGIGLLVYASSQHGIESALAARGVHTTGRVVFLERTRLPNGQDQNNNLYSYTITVQFPTKKGFNQLPFGATGDAYRALEKNSPVEVIYDPTDPDVALLGGDMNPNPSSKFTLFGIGVIVLGIVIGIANTVYARQLKLPAAPDLDEALVSAQHATPQPHWTNDPLHEEGSEKP
jgi:hypothetical protein